MKFSNPGIIKDIVRYKWKDKLCFITDKRLFIEENSFQIFETPIDGFVVFKDRVYINDWNGKYIVYDQSGKLVETGEGKAFFESSIFYLGHQYLNDDKIQEALLSQNSEIINIDILNKQNSINFSNRNIYCCLKSISIHVYSLPNAKLLWQFNLTDLGTYTPFYKQNEKPFEVAKFLGVWQNELLIACNGGLILALDSQTGAIARKWQGLPIQADSYLHEVFRGQLYQHGYVYQLNQAKTRVDAFFLHYYFNIDLQNGTMNFTNCKVSLQQYHIEQFKYSSAYAEDETHLYTKVTYDNKALGLDYIPTGLCAFNKQTFELDWQYRFDKHDDYLATDNPQLSGNKLYQLSATKVLYIFEKMGGS